jgi:hypothetical protein
MQLVFQDQAFAVSLQCLRAECALFREAGAPPPPRYAVRSASASADLFFRFDEAIEGHGFRLLPAEVAQAEELAAEFGFAPLQRRLALEHRIRALEALR